MSDQLPYLVRIPLGDSGGSSCVRCVLCMTAGRGAGRWVASLDSTWTRKFRLMLAGVMLSLICCVTLLLWGWYDMAQTGIEQPGTVPIPSMAG